MPKTPNGRPTEPIPLAIILRETLRRYSEFKDYVSATGKHVIDHGYFIYEDDLITVKGKINVSVSFWDLLKGIDKLSPRKRQALWLNIIMDKKQKDVADIMGITTVSVGQYTANATAALAEQYFVKEEIEVYKDYADKEREHLLSQAGSRP